MNQYPKYTVEASMIGLVAGVMMGVATNNAAAFWLGSVIVGGVALSILKQVGKD